MIKPSVGGPPPSDGREPPVMVRPLTPADIPDLNLAHHPRLQGGEAEALVVQSPGLSQWIPETGEFALVAPWRHRQELPWIHTLWGFRHDAELVAAVVAAAEQQGRDGVIYMDAFESRRPSFYEINGLELLESIVTYELSQPYRLLGTMDGYRQRFLPVRRDVSERWDALLELDHAAFPWLWWNSAEEFAAYARMPNVELWVGLERQEVVSYIGITHYHGWGHLDRIATHPDRQGQGFGREALHYAVRRLVDRGARRVGLSTQGDNARSRRLYESVGFRETPAHHYGVYGVVFASGRTRLAQGG
mgnify:CR=1 FL=1